MMQVLASHLANRAVPTGAERAYAVDLLRQHQPADADPFDATANIVELSVFKKAAPSVDREPPSLLGDNQGLSTDLAMSLLEEVQQARFREARRVKRIETLEYEIRLARAQNEALRTALQTSRGDADETRPDFDLKQEVGRRKLSRSFMRLFRTKH